MRWVAIGPNRATPAFFFTSALRGKSETGEQAGQPPLSAAQLYGNLFQRIVKIHCGLDKRVETISASDPINGYAEAG
jgi:hypothetical protein